MRLFFFLLLAGWAFGLSGQADSLNRFDQKHKKHGYWKIYVDANTEPADSAKALFYGFEQYDHGQEVFRFNAGSWRHKNSIAYSMATPLAGRPVALQDTFTWRKPDGTLYAREIYNNGHPVKFESYLKAGGDSIAKLSELIDFTQHYNGDPSTYYYWLYASSPPAYEGWYRKGPKGWRMYKCLNPGCHSEMPLCLARGSKTEEITSDLDLSLQTYESDSTSIYKSRETIYRGRFVKVSDDSLFLQVSSESTTLEKRDGSGETITRTYTNRVAGPGQLPKMVSIDIKNISSISYSEQSGVSNSGIALTSFALTGAVFAPLFCINYKTGNFNQVRYYSILAGCGITIAVSIPFIAIFQKQKSYTLKATKYSWEGQDYYKILTH